MLCHRDLIKHADKPETRLIFIGTIRFGCLINCESINDLVPAPRVQFINLNNVCFDVHITRQWHAASGGTFFFCYDFLFAIQLVIRCRLERFDRNNSIKIK